MRELTDDWRQYQDITCVNCDEAPLSRGKWDLFDVVTNRQEGCIENPFSGGT